MKRGNLASGSPSRDARELGQKGYSWKSTRPDLNGPRKAPVQPMVNTEAAYEEFYIAARQKSVAGGARAG